MRNSFWMVFLVLMFAACSLSSKSEIKLPFFTNFKDAKGWSLDAGAKFDPKVSVTPGSGSIRLEKAGDSWVTSDRIVSDFSLPVEAGKTYTLSFKSLTQTFPPPALEVYGSMLGKEGQIDNSDGTMCANSQKGAWEENDVLIRIPQNESIKYFKIKIFMLPKYGKSAAVWIDDVRFEEGVKLPKMSPKKAFEGSVTRVDEAGNVEIKKGDAFEPFFPIGIYTDENRADWSIYRKMGFNMNMWASDAASIQKSKSAGLYAMMQIVQYIVPVSEEWIPQDPKKKVVHLHRTLQQIRKRGLWKDLLFYYVDNEFYHIDSPFTQVIDIVRKEDKQSHPIYMLNGAYGLTRMYNDYCDLTGTYVAKDSYETPIVENLAVMQHTPNQKLPVVFAQINRGVGKNFRAIVYASLAKGAKGIGFWRDGGSAGAIENRPVFKQLPQIAGEIKKLMPLIRAPIQTVWKVESNADQLTIGTRTLDGEGYLIIANPFGKFVQATLGIKGLSYKAQKAVDFFSHRKVATLHDDRLEISVKPYEAFVLRLEK